MSNIVLSPSFAEPVEVKLHAPPDTTRLLLKEVAATLDISGAGRFRIEDVRHTYGPGLSVRIDQSGRSGPIGLIFLLPLTDGRTLLRVPVGRGTKNQASAYERDPQGRLFLQYLQAVFQEMRRLGFISERGRFNSASVLDSAIQSLASAADSHGYAAVANVCRSALIALANEVYQPDMLRPGAAVPKGDDAPEKLKLAAGHYCAGMSERQSQGFLKVIDGIWGYSVALLHRRNAIRQEAEVCVTLVAALYDSFALMMPS